MRHVLHFSTRPWLNAISSSSTLRASPSAWNPRYLLYRELHTTRPCRSPTEKKSSPEYGRRLARRRRNVPLIYVQSGSVSPLHAFVDHLHHEVGDDDLTVKDRADPASWADLLERLLPPEQRTLSSNASIVPADLAFAQALFWRSRQLLGTNVTFDPSILLWMANNGRYKALVVIVDILLKQIAAETSAARSAPLSNLDWPSTRLYDICCEPISCDALKFRSQSALRDEHLDSTEAQEKPAVQRVLGEIWSLLGHLVIQSADAPVDDAEKLVSVTMLGLARIHNLGLLPDHIYSHSPIPASVTAQRPPILHMVSSRIFAALSDATWRGQQDDAIAKAASLGMTLHQISRDAPGGRFRLQVRPLGAEIWLELILWCCIESGHSLVAARLIKQLQKDKTSPWYAVRWTSKDTGDLIESRIDRDRIKLRHGGVVGLIEGYSREKPFIEVPVRTISVESILALSDALINDMIKSDSAEEDMARSMDILASVVSFIDPHDLPSTFLDYLAVRLVEAGSFDISRIPILLKDWTEHVYRLRKLRPVDAITSDSLSLNLDNIGRRALTHIALQHQALDALIQHGDIHNALQVFNDIQEASDALKMESLARFLHSQPLSEDGTNPTHSLQSEFVDSHGELPGYKLAGFLNLVIDSNLINLGQWLLYADDLDGALIKPSMYGHSAFVAALFRFAVISSNSTLLDQVQSATRARKLMPSVRQLRALANALLSIGRFDPALATFKELQRAQHGGAGISNLVQIAAMAFRVHDSPDGEWRRSSPVARILSLLPRLLGGNFKGMRSDFTQTQHAVFEQQVAHIALILSRVNNRHVRRAAEKILQSSHPGNRALLPARSFNVVLSAVVDVDGSTAGRRLWEMFCKDPQNHDRIDARIVGDEIIDFEESFAAEENADYQSDEHSGPVAVSGESLRAKHSDITSSQSTSSNSRFSQDIPWSTQDSAEKVPIPITVPNLSTLRIILRAATAEKARKLAEGQDVTEQIDNLNWASQTLKLFGMRRRDIAFEFEEPVSTTLQEAYESGHRLRLESSTDTILYAPRVMLDHRLGKMFSR